MKSLKPILGEQAAVREILVAYDLMENCSESITPETPLKEALNIISKGKYARPSDNLKDGSFSLSIYGSPIAEFWFCEHIFTTDWEEGCNH